MYVTVTVELLTEHTAGVLVPNVTARPDDAVADRAAVSPTFRGLNGCVNEIACDR
jgi:hypothetical protein